jgi:hypothetical protein
MKKLFLFITALILSLDFQAQAPQNMTYQAVIRNASNALVSSTMVGMRISVLQGSPTGAAVYVETDLPTTNADGLISIQIGSGTVVSGTFSSIAWSAGPYFLQTEVDPLGGTAYTITGTSALGSVPYALFAANSGSSGGWVTTGNAGTADATNFIGTTDNVPFNIRMNNKSSGRIDSVSGNTYFGYKSGNFPGAVGIDNTVIGMQSLQNNTSGNWNTAAGYHSLVKNTIGTNNTGYGFCSLVNNTTGSSNTSLGNWTLFQNSASYNTAVGDSALYSNTTGTGNAALGYQGLTANTTGVDNTVIGMQSLEFNTTGSWNTAAGYHSLVKNTIGTNNTGYGFCSLVNNTTGSSNTSLGNWTLFLNSASYNTAVGDSALYSNTTGTGNAAVGYQGLTANTTGVDNTVIGMQSLQFNTTGSWNTAAGYHSLVKNTIGTNNTGYGFCSLVNNTTGSSNTSLGNWTLFQNAASYNTAVGDSALYSTTTGTGNTAIGYQALTNNTVGANNTAIGNMTDVGTSFSNSTVIGYQASASQSNVVVLGNASIQKLYCAQTSITAISDGRFKKNVVQDIHGLDFILKLRPVSYYLDVTKLNDYQGKKTDEKDLAGIQQAEAIHHNGFIAQEVEKAAQEVNYDFSGLKAPENSKDTYGIGYTDFVVPLVKAVQELNAANEKLKAENAALKMQIDNQTAKINNLQTAQTGIDKELVALKVMVEGSAGKNDSAKK